MQYTYEACKHPDLIQCRSKQALVNSNAESHLLAVSCSQARELLSGDIQLFAATPLLHKVANQSER